MRTDDPYNGYVAGLGCYCALCKEPLPEPAVQTPEQAAVLQAEYAASRVRHNELHGQTGKMGR